MTVRVNRPIAAAESLQMTSAVLTLTGQPAGARAVGVLTLTGNAVAAETVTIGSTVYTWRATVGTTAFEVLVGANAAASIVNLVAAINLTAGAGTLYGSLTTIHPTVRAADGTGDTVDVRANLAGTAGNSIATTETMTNASFGGANLSGGVAPETFTADGVVYSFVTALPEAGGPPNPTVINEVLIGASASATLDNLIAAMNGAAGAGTTYATGTVAQTRITATAGTGDTIDFTPKTAGGASSTPVTLAEAIANGSLNRTSMADGTFYAFEIPLLLHGGGQSIQIVWHDATSAFTGSYETTNQDDKSAPVTSNDACDWSAEADVTIPTVTASAKGSNMVHLNGVNSHRSRMKIVPTAVTVLSVFPHQKE